MNLQNDVYNRTMSSHQHVPRDEMAVTVEPMLRTRKRRSASGAVRGAGTVMSPNQPAPMRKYPKVYRVHFSVSQKRPSFMRPLKQSICWKFGLTNLAAIKKGCVGRECRGEEHEVEIVVSMKNGKGKVTWKHVLWNKRDISSLFSRESHKDITWKARSGETLSIVRLNPAPPGGIHFDLLVDGVKFPSLPRVGELGRSQYSSEDHSPFDNSSKQCEDSISSFSDSASRLEETTSSDSDGNCLSLVGGADQRVATNRDELESDLSRVLDPVRDKITSHLPQTENMVSRAIVNALVSDAYSTDSFDSISFDSMALTMPHQVEVEFIKDAYDWVALNLDFAPRLDADELALRLLQKRIFDIFLLVRNDELSSDDAARIVLSVAAVLGLRFAVPLPIDTIVLKGVTKDISVRDLYQALSVFGDVKAAALSSKVGIGFCRFSKESAADTALEGLLSNDLVIGKSKLTGHILRDVDSRQAMYTSATAALDEKKPCHDDLVALSEEMPLQDSPICVAQIVDNHDSPRHEAPAQSLNPVASF